MTEPTADRKRASEFCPICDQSRRAPTTSDHPDAKIWHARVIRVDISRATDFAGSEGFDPDFAGQTDCDGARAGRGGWQ